MKKTLTARIVHRIYSKKGWAIPQRVYELSEEVDKFPYTGFNLEEEKSRFKQFIREKYDNDLEDKIKYIIISDAHTHIERLAFAAIKNTNPETCDAVPYLMLSTLHIDGKMTLMTEGGSERHVHPDGVYLRRIASANNYNFRLIEDEIQD